MAVNHTNYGTSDNDSGAANLRAAFRGLDVVAQCVVISASTTAEPGAPTAGDTYILPSGKTGTNWAGMTTGSLVRYDDAGWTEIAPKEGWLAFVQDGNYYIYWTGSVWADINAAVKDSFRVLAASAVAASHTGDTNETTLATVTIPAGAMGANGVLRVTTLWSATNSANTKTARVDFGGTDFLAITPMTSAASWQELNIIRNRNNQSSQVGAGANFHGIGSGGSAAVVTASVNTANAVDLTITGQLANSGETITLEAYLVELLYKA